MEIVALNFDNLDPASIDGATVRKHNDLIEARYQIPNIQEQRVIFMLLAQIKPDDEDFKGYRISVTDFASILGIRPDNMYERLEATAQSLLSRTLKIKNGKSFLMANWLSSAEYRHGSGYIELCFDPKLKPYLLQLKDHFTQYKLEAVLHFKSVYSIRLYEMLKKEAFKAKKDRKFEVEYSYEFLREAFEIGKKEYKLFADFKRFTINPAVTEIYDKTDLNIYEVVYGKTGRAVSRILFRVEVREKAEAEVRALQTQLGDEPKERSQAIHPIMQALMDNGFSIENAKTYKTKYGIKRISRNLAYMKAEQMNGKKIENKAGYLTTAIKEDWGEAWESEHKKQQEEIQKKKKEAEEKEAQAEKRRIEIKARYDKTLQAFYALDEEIRQEIETEFKEFLEVENTQLLKYYQSARKLNGDQWGNTPQIKITFVTFLMTRGF